jgi:copper homeostasis protein
MLKDIIFFREIGVHGFVFGCLRNDGRIDKEICSRLIEAAKGMPVTFHRAFDMTADPFEALDTLYKLGIKRILTSGQEDKAMEGIPLISRLVDAAGEEVILMAGGGVNEGNIAQIAKETGVKAFHISVREPHESEMKYRREGIHMGGSDEFNEFEYKFTSSERVKACIRQLEEID